MSYLTKTNLLLLTIGLTSVYACKKDDAKFNEGLLTAVSCWQIYSIEVYDSPSNQWNALSLDDCILDDCITFRSDKTAKFDAGATKCDSSDPQTEIGTWSLSADGKTFSATLTSSGETLSGTFIELSSSKFVLESENTAIFNKKSRSTFIEK